MLVELLLAAAAPLAGAAGGPPVRLTRLARALPTRMPAADVQAAWEAEYLGGATRP